MLLIELEDPKLKELASKLPSTILHSRANGTTRKYLGAFRLWKVWATSHKLVPIPARPHEVAYICSICLMKLDQNLQWKKSAML